MDRINVNRPAPSLLQEKAKQRSGMTTQALGTEHVAFSGMLERMLPQEVGDPPSMGRQTAYATEDDSVAASGMAGTAQVLSNPLDDAGMLVGALRPEGSKDPSLEALSRIKITFSTAAQDPAKASVSETVLTAVSLEGLDSPAAPFNKGSFISSQRVADLAFREITEGASDPHPLSNDPLEALHKISGDPPGLTPAALSEASDEVARESNPRLSALAEAPVAEPVTQTQKEPGRDVSGQTAVRDVTAEISGKPSGSEAEMPSDRSRLENVERLGGIPTATSSPGVPQRVVEWPEAPVALKEVPELWLEQAKNLKADGAKHLRLTLKPEHLGHLEIELRLKNGVLSGVVTVETELTHGLIQKQWPQILSTLEAQQMSLGTFETLYKEGWSDHGPSWETPSRQELKPQGSHGFHNDPASEAAAGSAGASGHLDLYA